MARPAQISREKILEAAGTFPLDELSMTAVANRLGVTHASLYKYFPSRSALLAAVFAEAGERIDVPSRDGQSWQQWVIEAGVCCRDHLVTSVGATGILMSSGVNAALGTMFETFVEVLYDAGFESLVVWDAWALFVGFCVHNAANVRRVQLLVTDEGLRDAVAGMFGDFEASPPAVIRLLRDVVPSLDLDDDFRRGLDILIAGWVAQRDASQLGTHS